MKQTKFLISALLLFIAAIIAFIGDAVAVSICFLIASGCYFYHHIKTIKRNETKE